jgi:hypothetical protein
MIRDRNIAWKTKRVFLPAHLMSGLLEDGTSKVLTSLGAGTPVLGEVIAAAQLAGMPMDAADEVFHFWPIPWDMDRAEPFRVRLHFIHKSTDADAPVFKTFYKAIARQEALTAANSSADETLTHSAHTCSTTNNSYEVTSWKSSASNTKIGSSDIALLFAFELDALGGATADECVLLGAEIEYTVKATDEQRKLTSSEPVASV